MAVTTTKRSLDLMRKRGYDVTRVEHWNAWGRVRVDCCGCDLLALKAGEPPLLIQVTTASHRNDRANKLQTLESAKLWIQAGGRIVIHGWQPLTASRRKYEVIETEWEPGAPSAQGELCKTRRSRYGTLTVHRVVELDDPDRNLAVKQIATRATEDAGAKHLG